MVAVGSIPPRTRRPGLGWWITCLSKYVEPELIEPTFLFDYPVELSPLAKLHRSEPGLVERFEAFAGGMEFANAFTELNDPDDQRARFEAQRADAAAGDEEAHPYDEAYIRALEHGMPPTGGIGIGIDRLVMLLTGRDTIREVVLFPALRSLRLCSIFVPVVPGYVNGGIEGCTMRGCAPSRRGLVSFGEVASRRDTPFVLV